MELSSSHAAYFCKQTSWQLFVWLDMYIWIYAYFDTSLPKSRNGNSMGHGKKCNENSNFTKRLLMVSCKPQKNATEECKPVE